MTATATLETTDRIDLERELVVRASKDEAFRRRLLANPKAAIEKAFGGMLPEDIRVEVHEETATTVHLVLPHVPDDFSFDELSEEELMAAAGLNGMNVYAGSESETMRCSCVPGRC